MTAVLVPGASTSCPVVALTILCWVTVLHVRLLVRTLLPSEVGVLGLLMLTVQVVGVKVSWVASTLLWDSNSLWPTKVGTATDGRSWTSLTTLKRGSRSRTSWRLLVEWLQRILVLTLLTALLTNAAAKLTLLLLLLLLLGKAATVAQKVWEAAAESSTALMLLLLLLWM